MKKKVICFEGIDGAGKTLQLTLLHRQLTALGCTCSVLSFPRYDSFFGKEIGSLLANNDGPSAASVDAKSMCLWYALDRWFAYNKELRETTQTDFVLINRYTLSSVVYQSARGDLNLAAWIKQLEHEILHLPEPDLYLVLDVPPSITSENVRKKGVRDYIGDKKDIYEADHQLQARAAALYREFAVQAPNAVLISCTCAEQMRPADEISDLVLSALRHRELL